MIFGKERDKGLRPNEAGTGLEIVPLSDGTPLMHDQQNRHLAAMLAALEPPLPVAVGILLDDPAPATYERAVQAQNALERRADASLNEALRRGATWRMV